MTAKIIPLKAPKVAVWEVVSDNLVLHVPTGHYYVRKYKSGKGRLFKSTGETKKGIAQHKADYMIAEWLGNKRKGTGRRKRVSDIRDEVLDHLEKLAMMKDPEGRPMRRRRTADKDRTYLADKTYHGKPITAPIVEYFGDTFLDEIDEQFWADWVTTSGWKLDRKLGDIAKYLSLVMGYAFDKKYINRKPRFKNPDKHKKRAVVYEDEDIEKFIEHAEPMLRDLLIIAGENPIRPHELREMRWDFVSFIRDAEGVRIAVVRLPDWFTKTEEGREFQLSPQASEVIYRRFTERNKGAASEFVFPAPKDPLKSLSDVQLSRMWRRMLDRAGITKDIKFHWTRHSAYSKLLLDLGTNIAKVSEFGGTSIATLQKNYLRSDHQRTAEVGRGIKLKIGKK
jgi:integrase